MIAQDVSRLVDLCRQCIVFEEVSDLVKCLNRIKEDADIKIVRIKNRMDPEYLSLWSAGYRDVSMNLCIVTDMSKNLGIDSHVCELQLILRSIAALKVRSKLFWPNVCNLFMFIVFQQTA
jgi:hypothetical protein